MPASIPKTSSCSTGWRRPASGLSTMSIGLPGAEWMVCVFKPDLLRLRALSLVPSAFTDTVHMERNPNYLSNYLSGPEKERWYWSNIQGYVSGSIIHTATRRYPFDLFNPADGLFDARLRLRLYGYAGLPQHHTVYTINDQPVGNQYWPNIGSIETQPRFSPIRPHLWHKLSDDPCPGRFWDNL